MKKLFTLILMSALIFTLGCKKDKQLSPVGSIIGSWEIRKEIGGQIAGAPDAFEPGNGNILRFSDKTYAYIQNGVVLYSGAYTIGSKGSGTAKENTLIFVDNGGTRTYEIDNNKLTIYHGVIAADGNILIYEKVQENTPILH